MFRPLVFSFLSVSLAIVGVTARAASSENEDLFQKGLAAYHSKQYSEARDLFQKLMDQGQTSPALLNNMALTVYALDQKPLALALWRKALSIAPGFRPAEKGRDLLETKMQMRPLERDSFKLWLHRTLESFSLQILLILTAVLLALAGWFGIRYWGERGLALETESPLPALPLRTVLFLTAFALSVVVTGLKIKDGMSTRATIVEAKASVRSLPADEGVALFDLSGGSEVYVRQTQNGWTQVQNSDGSGGWVKNTDLMVTN